MKPGRAKSERDFVHAQHPETTRANHELFQWSTYSICGIDLPVFKGRINKDKKMPCDEYRVGRAIHQPLR